MTAPRARTNHAAAAWKLVALLGITVAYAVRFLWARARAADARMRREIAVNAMHRWSRRACNVFGWRVRAVGPVPPAPALLVPNHLGYLDIVTLGAAVPSFFLTRADVLSWPIVGVFLRLTEQPSVTRRRARDLADSGSAIADRLGSGQRVVAFLEGTSTGGDTVLPFRSPLFEAPISVGAPVVPVAIHWRPSRPGVDVAEDIAYWRPEHTFLPHLWRLLGLGPCEVEFRIAPAIPTAGRDRKELAATAHAEVLRLLAESRSSETAARGFR